VHLPGKSGSSFVYKYFCAKYLFSTILNLASLISGNPDYQHAAMAENNRPDAAAYAASTLCLTPFWPDAPTSWFQMAEAQFHQHGVAADYDKYCLLLASLPKESFRMISHLVELDRDCVPDDVYTQLKHALVSRHMMLDYKKVELLSKVEPLGGWRPSELLATMLELCPHGHETLPFFAYLFLQCLPHEIRVLLADDKPRAAVQPQEEQPSVSTLYLAKPPAATAGQPPAAPAGLPPAAPSTQPPAAPAGQPPVATAGQPPVSTKQQPPAADYPEWAKVLD
jgi:hypothetical protein